MLEADIEIAEFSDAVDERGYNRVRQRCQTTLRFRNIAQLSLQDFRSQNVLDELLIQLLDASEAERRSDPWEGARRFFVEFLPIPGFCTLSFRCDSAEVVHAKSLPT